MANSLNEGKKASDERREGKKEKVSLAEDGKPSGCFRWFQGSADRAVLLPPSDNVWMCDGG